MHFLGCEMSSLVSEAMQVETMMVNKAFHESVSHGADRSTVGKKAKSMSGMHLFQGG